MDAGNVFRRDELYGARLHLGGSPIELDDYATTGIRMAVIGPSGCGKSNAALLMAEQLATQGWVSVLVDPESELEALYGQAVADADELRERLIARDKPIVVVSARDAEAFLPYGEVVLQVAESERKPLLLVLDEGQLFSCSNRKRANSVGAASDLVTQIAERGRKRRLDLCVTALRSASSLNRSVFNSANITLVGRLEDAASWQPLAPRFKAAKITFSDLAALTPGQFYALSLHGIDKLTLPMANALAKVAPKARTTRATVPTTFTQWDRAMRAVPTERLMGLSAPVVDLLASIAGLSAQQRLTGDRALADEIEVRA